MKGALEMQFRETNLRAFRIKEIKGDIPKRFLLNSKVGSKRRRLNGTAIYGEGLPTREIANHQIDSRIPKIRTLKQILTALEG